MQTYHLSITGKVHGVFFRQSAKEQADQSGITGVVKNTAEGAVDIVFSGCEEQAAAFIEWCKKGPKKAIVKDVTIDIIRLKEFQGFTIMR